jgi:ectoine hydroxylase-related dioxygenase (phytanoyl-CoA dioxygenase family)
MNRSWKEEFAAKGYIVLNQLFTRGEVEKLKKEAVGILSKQDAGKNGVFLGMAARGALFKKAAAHPVLVAALKEIIGDHVVFLNDKLVFKNSTTSFGSPWHQDHPYWWGSYKYSVWIALDDAAKENGCLRVVPGSHLLGSLKHGADASDGHGFDNRVNASDIDESQVVDLDASLGDAIIFHDLLLHASYPNISGKERWAIISTYKDGTQEDPDYDWATAAFTVGE